MTSRLSQALRSVCDFAQFRNFVFLARARLASLIAPKRKPQRVVVGAPNFEEALHAAGFQMIPLEKLLGRPPAPVTRREVSLPSADVIDRMRADMEYHDWTCVDICRGTKKGCNAEDQQACRYCYSIKWYDKRSSAEILQAIERGDS